MIDDAKVIERVARAIDTDVFCERLSYVNAVGARLDRLRDQAKKKAADAIDAYRAALAEAGYVIVEKSKILAAREIAEAIAEVANKLNSRAAR